jgi:transglutaminase-like putative cysteine protease
VLTLGDRRPPSAVGPEAAPRPTGRPRSGRSFTEAQAYPAATLALLGLTLASTAGLLRVFTGHHWLGPILLIAIGVHAVCWASRRARLGQLLSLVLALVAVWVLSGWTVLGSSTVYGFPAGRTASELANAIGQARADFALTVTPTTPTRGLLLMTVLGTGLIAILGDWAAFRLRSALLGALPGFVFFIVCCTVGAGSGRQLVVGLEVAAILIFLLTHRTEVGRADQAWFGNYRSGSALWAVKAGSLIAATSMLAAIAVTPALGPYEGRAILGWRGGIGGSGSGPRQVPNPVVDLHSRLLEETDTPVFTVHASVPSYWRLTSLDTFTGQDWISTNSYRGFGPRLPGIQAVPLGTRVVQDQFVIQQLDSVWLPDAFTPLAVTGVHNVSYDPTSGSLITSRATSNGLSYTVDSYQYLSSLNAAEVQAAPPVAVTSSLRRYLQLPDNVPASVYQLAREITSGQTTEYGKALALQNYFQGPLFTYSLDPPDNGYGIDSLTNFLFATRTGFCQQFAGAYAVLARAIGLPTRLAVGFAEGTATGDNNFQVLNADAHTWPEVYFGPRFGWLPFEPTKSFTDPASQGYAPQASANTGPSAQPKSEGQLPIKQGAGADQSGATTTAPSTTTPSGGSGSASAGSGHHAVSVWVVLLVLVGGLLAWTAGVAGFRRTRWSVRRWRVRHDPGSLVLAHWADVGELLNWWGASRASGETDNEFAGRAGRQLARRLREPAPWLPGGIVRLAGLATEAAFAPTVSSERAEEARLVARQIHQRLFRSASGRQLVLWAVYPRPHRAVSAEGGLSV